MIEISKLNDAFLAANRAADQFREILARIAKELAVYVCPQLWVGRFSPQQMRELSRGVGFKFSKAERRQIGRYIRRAERREQQ